MIAPVIRVPRGMPSIRPGSVDYNAWVLPQDPAYAWVCRWQGRPPHLTATQGVSFAVRFPPGCDNYLVAAIGGRPVYRRFRPFEYIFPSCPWSFRRS